MSNTRLYGSSIAIISGGYSLYLSTSGMAMNAPAWFMLVLGIIVILHGVTLLTPLAESLGAGSGMAMIVYAVLMLGNQIWMTMMRPVGMGTMGWDPGMIAIAVLMLISGLIMTLRRDMM